MAKEYYLCSEKVVELLKPIEVSNSIEVYPNEQFINQKVFIAVLDFTEVEVKYKEIKDKKGYWAEEIVSGQMNINSIKVKDFEKSDPFSVIEEKLNMTKMNNRAMTICELARREGLNPIEFWNKIA